MPERFLEMSSKNSSSKVGILLLLIGLAVHYCILALSPTGESHQKDSSLQRGWELATKKEA